MKLSKIILAGAAALFSASRPVKFWQPKRYLPGGLSRRGKRFVNRFSCRPANNGRKFQRKFALHGKAFQ